MQTLTVIGASARPHLVRVLESRLQEFAASWFDTECDVQVEFGTSLFSDSEITKDDYVVEVNHGMVVLKGFAETLRALSCRALHFAGESTETDDHFWQHMTQEILNSLLRNLCPVLETVPSASDTCSRKIETIASALSIKANIANIEVELQMDRKALSECGALQDVEGLSRKTLLPASDALGASSVQLQAALTSASISLEELVELKRGDVIKLEHQLEQPIILKTSSGYLNVNAYLVALDNAKAIYLSGK